MTATLTGRLTLSIRVPGALVAGVRWVAVTSVPPMPAERAPLGYRNPIDRHGIAATIKSAMTSTPISGLIRHSETSGLVRPIAQAP
jgi:hypothetical protein